MISLYCDPEGEYMLTTNNTVNQATNEKNANFVTKDETTQLRKRVTELETVLKDYQQCQVW